MTRYRVGVDIGGTFTDIVFLGEHGERLTKKVSSTIDNYATAIVDGLRELIREQSLEDAEIVELLHGTTVASNAILELKGARTGLITTKGFRDVLEIRTLRMPRLYDLSWTKPPPLIERHLRVEVDERGNARGGVERPLTEADAARAIGKLVDEGVEAIAVCLIHSYLNPVHEQLIKTGGRPRGTRRNLMHQRRSIAGDQGIRADLDDRHQCVCQTDCRKVPVEPDRRAGVHRGRRAASADAIEWWSDHRQGCRRDSDEHHRKRAGGGGCRSQGADPSDRHREGDLVRHGRNYGQGVDHRR